MTNIHCPMIHGGLQINLKAPNNRVYVNQCCLRKKTTEAKDNIWADPFFDQLRHKNKQNIWDDACWTCRTNENSGQPSLRTGMLDAFGPRTNLSGPVRLDLMFDIGCNLACRTCGPSVSTFWQRHLKEHHIPFVGTHPASRANDMIKILHTLDLSNLEMVVFCGGETLLGTGYWQVAEEIARIAPADKITMCFQTNGTQTINPKHYSIIEKFNLVKLHISLDGVGDRYNYLRWPADWHQVVANIQQLKQTLPVNVMFLIEETVSIFNLYYQQELSLWVQQHFDSNRLGDTVTHTRHLAEGIFGLHNLSAEYINALDDELKRILNPNFKGTDRGIELMLEEIHKFDQIRQQNWAQIFPEVAEFYSKYCVSGR